MESVSEDKVSHTFMVRNRLRTMRETQSQTETHSQTQIHTLHKYCALTISLEKTNADGGIHDLIRRTFDTEAYFITIMGGHMELVNTLGFSKHFTFSLATGKGFQQLGMPLFY